MPAAAERCPTTPIGALSRALGGYKPDDLQWLDDLRGPFSETSPSEPHPLQRFEPLKQPLSVMPQTAYHFLLGVCRELEGIPIACATGSYFQASLMLTRQIEDTDDIIILQSVDLLRSWLEDATRKEGMSCSKDSSRLVHARKIMERMKERFQVAIGKEFVSLTRTRDESLSVRYHPLTGIADRQVGFHQRQSRQYAVRVRYRTPERDAETCSSVAR